MSFTPVQVVQPAMTVPGVNTQGQVSVNQTWDVQPGTLTPQQRSQVDQYKKAVNTNDIKTIQTFGSNVQSNVSGVVENMLGQVKTNKLGDIGKQLNQVVVLSNELPLKQFAQQKDGFMYKILPFLKLTRAKFLGKFESCSGQIEQIAKQLVTSRTNHEKSITDFEKMVKDCEVKYQHLALLTIAGKEKLEEEKYAIQQEEAALQATTTPDPIRAQALLTKKNLYNVLEMRVTNLERVQHSTLQKIPQIRMMQFNAFQLVEKLRVTVELTIPEWKNTFGILLYANDQQNTANFLNKVDDMHNQVTRLAADALHDASIAVAQSSQRAVLDFDTLKHVHDKFLQTMDEVKQIVESGRAEREQVSNDLLQLKSEMFEKIAQG